MTHSAPVGYGDVHDQEREEWIAAVRELIGGDETGRFGGVPISAVQEHCDTTRASGTIAHHCRGDDRVIVRQVPSKEGGHRVCLWPAEVER